MRKHKFVYQEVRIISFLKTFAYIPYGKFLFLNYIGLIKINFNSGLIIRTVRIIVPCSNG